MNNRLFVGNLPYPATKADLEVLFDKIGLVSSIEIVCDRRSQSQGYAFVTVSNESEAERAIEALNGHTLRVQGAERNLYVSLAK